MLIGEPLQLGTAYGSHPCSFPAVLLGHVLDVLSHRCSGLPLLVLHLPDDLHIRHLRTVRCSGGLPYAKVLDLSSVPSLLDFIECILVPTELRYFRCVP